MWKAKRRRVLKIEHLPKWALCIPLVIQWLWLGLRYQSLTLPSTVNPRIATGGLVGESKWIYLDQVKSEFRQKMAPTCRVGPGDKAENIRTAAALSFPLIAKPDIGWCGFGVRRINNAEELARYAHEFPRFQTFLLQRFLSDPVEAGLFYIRQPDGERGAVTAITLRHHPSITGDGVSCVDELVTRSFFNRQNLGLGTIELNRVPPVGEVVYLTTVASLRIGGRYDDASHAITLELSHAVDDMCRSMGDFHWGRLDVKCVSMDALRRGEFTVFEINGAGSEAIHLWDPRLSIRQAFQGVFAKQRTLFALAAIMRLRGYRPVGVIGLTKAYLRQQKLIALYPPSN